MKKWILHYEDKSSVRMVESFDDILNWFGKANGQEVRVSEFPMDMSEKFGDDFKTCYAIRYYSKKGDYTYFNVGYANFTDERYYCNPYENTCSWNMTITCI